MNASDPHATRLPPDEGSRGFALVITLSLMILLALLAVGLLSISAVALRQSANGNAMAEAQANARLAMMLALGDLQKHAGPDTRITARADVRDARSANPLLTGVWDSWPIDAMAPPSASEYEPAARDRRFRRWVMSHPDPRAAALPETASGSLPGAVVLWSDRSPGADRFRGTGVVRAAPVPMPSLGGGVAWAALDEGVKVRVNTAYQREADSPGARSAQLGAGRWPNAAMLPGMGTLPPAAFAIDSRAASTIAKGVTPDNFALAATRLSAATKDAMRSLPHDVSVYSAGVFADVARGGLKEDFSMLANRQALPAAFNRRGIYASLLGMNARDVPADVPWQILHEFSRAYRGLVSKDRAGGAPMVRAQVPRGWQAAIGTPPADLILNTTPPQGLVLMPTVAKVQIVFSLIGRDLYDYPAPVRSPVPGKSVGTVFHGPQGQNFANTRFDFDLQLMYTPVVTLHNPYNVTLEFNTLRVEFVHTPLSLQVFRNGRALSNGLIPVDTMYADNDSRNVNNGNARGKVFGLNLKDKDRNGRPSGVTLRLLPGEVKVFSPYIDPNHTYRDNFRSGRQTWDIFVGTGITNNIDAIPGWRGDGMGYSCDWLAGGRPTLLNNFQEGQWESCYGLAADDRIHVEFAPLAVPSVSKNKFTVRMTALTAGQSQPVCVNAIEIDYERPTGLQDTMLGRGKTLRYPKNGTVRGLDMVDHHTTPIKDLKKLKPFAVLSVQGKTTSGARDTSLEDGRFATKPAAFGHPVVGASTYKFVTEHPANGSHELDLQVLEVGTGTANLVQVDPLDRGNFITGHTPFNGLKFGASYDLPLAPLQSLASLNGANPGGCTPFLPRFAQPIGNSWAHPMLPAASAIHRDAGRAYLDHSFLLNLALYDRYYFSGLADQTGPFAASDALTAAALAKRFAEEGLPLDDPRLVPYFPDGRPATALAEATEATAAESLIAAFQMMRGAFNINSTSVPAWKAMLASIRDPEAILLAIDRLNKTAAFADLGGVRDGEARVSRFRTPLSPSAARGGIIQEAYWLGPREYSDSELDRLARAIVDEVRERGPFLSMAEFVNRRLGTGETARSGALQAAIDKSGINRPAAEAANAGFEIPENILGDYRYRHLEAGAGPSYQGAPGFLTQADILTVLGNAATPRSDTFTIRGYGEARDRNGRVIATALCEAVVQRFPDWIDPTDTVETAPGGLKSVANQTFGRRFEIVSFRWLSQQEI